MELISLLSLLIAGGGVYIFSRVFRNFQPGNKKIQADLKKMQEEIDGLSVELAPLEMEELEAVSYSQEQHHVKKRFGTTARGVFTTIYHEPVIAYNFKRYSGSKIQALIFAKTTAYQFAYLIRKNGIQVVVNTTLVGSFREDQGILYDPKQKHVLAKLRPGPEGFHSIIVGQREVGSLAAVPLEKEVLSQRAFAFIKPDLNAAEIRLFLCVAILHMVQSVAPAK